jgi:hypothetical protein
MLEPTTRRPVEIVRQVEAPTAPAAALVLEQLGRMRPTVAITVVLATAGMAAGAVVAIVAVVGMVVAAVAAIVGTVALGALGLGIAAIVLGGRPTRR